MKLLRSDAPFSGLPALWPLRERLILALVSEYPLSLGMCLEIPVQNARSWPTVVLAVSSGFGRGMTWLAA